MTPRKQHRQPDKGRVGLPVFLFSVVEVLVGVLKTQITLIYFHINVISGLGRPLGARTTFLAFLAF
jgi:hypothetical protein